MDELPGESVRNGGDEVPIAGVARRPGGYFTSVALAAAMLIFLALVMLGRLGTCRWSPLCGPLTAEDISQARLDTALPAPKTGLRLEQTFVPLHDGLAEIEILLVSYGGEGQTGAEGGRFTLELRDENDALIAVEELATAQLSHNQVHTLRFEPQENSAGRRYSLGFSGSELNNISAWGYSLNVYDSGELRLAHDDPEAALPATAAVELRFTTRYNLTPGETLRAAVTPLREWRLLLAALVFLPLPGVLLLLALRPRGWDRAAWLGTALALSVAAWPILWQWVSLAGGRWSGALLWAAVAGGWVAVLVIARRRKSATIPSDENPMMRSEPVTAHKRSQPVIHLLVILLILITIASRFVAARDLAFPPWVDSSRHALITVVMLESGQVPTDYEPYLPVDRFPYHYGFHALSTSLALMTGHSLPGLLLFLMQLLGGLLPLAVYAAGWMVTRRPVVGLTAAFLVASPFFFPGYYATWGRMTQLAAMVVMPVLLALTWRLGRGWPRVWPLVGVLAAGLFLIHFRVFLFFLPYAALAAVAHLIGHRRIKGMVKAGALAVVLVAPRLIELLAATEPLETIQRSLPGYNDFPIGYITTGWERVYLVVAAVAAAVLIAGIILRKRWANFPLLLLFWTAGLFILLAGERLGLPESLVVNLNSMYITLFLPLALFLAIIAGQVGHQVSRRLGRSQDGTVRPAAMILAAVMVGAILGVLTLFGWRQQVNIINPQTVLALPQDVAALAWVDDNLPADALVAVSAWKWLGETWAGSDGGAWLVPTTGRESTTPPVDYIYNAELFAGVRAFNQAATAITDWSAPAAAEWLAGQGVSHVFVGRRGGYFDPAALSRNPSLEMIFRRDGTFVFAVR